MTQGIEDCQEALTNVFSLWTMLKVSQCQTCRKILGLGHDATAVVLRLGLGYNTTAIGLGVACDASAVGLGHGFGDTGKPRIGLEVPLRGLSVGLDASSGPALGLGTLIILGQKRPQAVSHRI